MAVWTVRPDTMLEYILLSSLSELVWEEMLCGCEGVEGAKKLLCCCEGVECEERGWGDGCGQ